MNYEAIEEYIKLMGDKEREEVRPYTTSPNVDYVNRMYAWQLMETFTVFFSGFLFCISIADSPEKAEYYREMFDQARSENGLDGDTT